MKNVKNTMVLLLLVGAVLLAVPARASTIKFDFQDYGDDNNSFSASETSGLTVSDLEGSNTTLYGFKGKSAYHYEPGHDNDQAAGLFSGHSGEAYTFTITPPEDMQLRLTHYHVIVAGLYDSIPEALRLDIAGNQGPMLGSARHNYQTNEGPLDTVLPAGQTSSINLTVVDEGYSTYIDNLELSGDLEPVITPEPMSMMLLGMGCIAGAMRRCRR